ncbi:histidine kinase dimerization/phospho-acceptor domain-containing protein [Sphingomonas paeninsulae]|uniref:histidine kinase dimerization/phospho-acceptor domain-containing protein n=1 Tax=Sphingomonas paeninsulae TaxID=2319844 RepID=UPI001EF045D3|nr:histidine kinase dimerization/phospho-acceptor domain-containing protein [Sphingomonas paeninsulae]
MRDFQAASREIASGRLDIRMPVSGRHDELDQFAIMVNVMVEDVARVMAQVKGITDAVAHDLRTPLTRLRGHLHRAQLLPDNTPSFANLAEKAVADLDQVLDRFAALLRISKSKRAPDVRALQQ